MTQKNENLSKGDFSEFIVRFDDRKSRTVYEDFSYLDERLGEITIPKGFTTDFASIGALKTPKLHSLYALLVGYGDRAATIHDYMYATSTSGAKGVLVTRKEADEVFYRALRSEGIARWRAWMFLGGVRLGGWFAWRKHRKNDVDVKSSWVWGDYYQDDEELSIQERAMRQLERVEIIKSHLTIEDDKDTELYADLVAEAQERIALINQLLDKWEADLQQN